MAVEGNKTQKESNNNFGLPKATLNPIEPRRSKKWLKITAIIAVMVLILGAGIVYWLFKTSSSLYNDFLAKALKKQTEETKPTSQDNLVEDITERLIKEAEDLDRAKNAASDQEGLLNLDQRPIPEISAPQGYYYVIVGSYIDKDLATDYAKKLPKQLTLTLIAPPKGRHFFRLAIDQATSFEEAKQKADSLKEAYGEQLWVLKY